MAMRIGLNVRWPNGTAGTISQEAIRKETGRDAFIVSLLAKRDGHPNIRGDLRYTAEAHARFPGDDDAVKSTAIGVKLATSIERNGLEDGFFFRVDVDDQGIQLL
jgi:hypothetical protein